MDCRECIYGKDDFERRMACYDNYVAKYGIPNEIYDKVTKDDIVIDYIDQCNTIFHKFGVHPSLPDYPDCLQPF